jgi:hypothetical protein
MQNHSAPTNGEDFARGPGLNLVFSIEQSVHQPVIFVCYNHASCRDEWGIDNNLACRMRTFYARED